MRWARGAGFAERHGIRERRPWLPLHDRRPVCAARAHELNLMHCSPVLMTIPVTLWRNRAATPAEAELWCSVPVRAGCRLSLGGRSLVLAGTKALDRCTEVVQRVKALINAGESQVGDEVKLL